MFDIAIININQEFETFRRMAEVQFHPNEVLARTIDLIQTIIINMGYSKNPYAYLFIKNELVSSGGLDYIPEAYYDLDQCIAEFTKGTMYDYNPGWIDEILHSIWNEIGKYYLAYPYCYIEPEYKAGTIILRNRGDIRALRYEEAKEYLEVKEEEDKEYL